MRYELTFLWVLHRRFATALRPPGEDFSAVSCYGPRDRTARHPPVSIHGLREGCACGRRLRGKLRQPRIGPQMVGHVRQAGPGSALLAAPIAFQPVAKGALYRGLCALAPALRRRQPGGGHPLHRLVRPACRVLVQHPGARSVIAHRSFGGDDASASRAQRQTALPDDSQRGGDVVITRETPIYSRLVRPRHWPDARWHRAVGYGLANGAVTPIFYRGWGHAVGSGDWADARSRGRLRD